MIGITRDARLLDPRRDPAVLVAGRPADLLHALPCGGLAGPWAGWRLEATGGGPADHPDPGRRRHGPRTCYIGVGRGGGVSEPATFPLATVALDPASGRPEDGPADVADEQALLRLALWLADVATEASSRRWDDRASNPDRETILAERAGLVVNAGGSAT